MFNARKFVESVLHESWKMRCDGVRSLSHAPRVLRELLELLMKIELDKKLKWSSGQAVEVEEVLEHVRQAQLVLARKLPWHYYSTPPDFLRDHGNMNQGFEMRFHPVTGDPIESLHVESRTEPCICYPRTGEWGQSRDLANPYMGSKTIHGQHFLKDGQRLPLIGDGRDHDEGDPYLAHWKFCPFTGEKLEELQPDADSERGNHA
jgi:hypothetical protein